MCILAFSLSAGMRLLEFPRWDPSTQQVNGEYILATHDAYFWVAGAEGVNQRSDGTAMAILLEVGAALFQNSPAQIAFWAPIFLAALTAIPIALWALQLGAPYAALLAAVLGSLAPVFYTRTRLGYYDTDWATLFFPLLISWLLAVWIQPRLRMLKHTEDDDSTARFEFQKPIIIVLVVAMGMPWHNFIPLYLTSLLWISVAFVVLFGRKGTRGASFTVLLAIALTVGFGWWGAILTVVILWVRRRIPHIIDRIWATRLTLGILLVLLLYLTWNQFESYLATTLSTYAASLVRDLPGTGTNTSFAYPDLVASLRETQVMTISNILEGAGFLPWLGILGIIGYAILLWKKPITFFLLPLLLLGLAATRLGARFAMFAAPVVFLGLFVPLDWGSALVSKKYGWGKRWRGVIAVSGLVFSIPWVYLTYARVPIESAISKGHAEVLHELGEITEPESLVWTWWDYGYATQYGAGSSTFADGGRNRGEYLFTLGHVFGTADLNHSAGMVRFATENDHLPWTVWETWDPNQMSSWLADLSEDGVGTSTLPPQYLVLQWEALQFLPWIQYFGSWDFNEGGGQRSRVVDVRYPEELDLNTGALVMEGEGEGFVVTVDILDERGLRHYAYPENAGGPHLLLDSASSEVLLLDETAYNSILVQLLISDPGGAGFAEPYELVIDAFPTARVFRLD
jgi:dolichyl-diphosphooligosaccharide--protein glycosyltransferase